jgi:hypothetical protein
MKYVKQFCNSAGRRCKINSSLQPKSETVLQLLEKGHDTAQASLHFLISAENQK